MASTGNDAPRTLKQSVLADENHGKVSSSASSSASFDSASMATRFLKCWGLFIELRDAYAASRSGTGNAREVGYTEVVEYAVSNREHLACAREFITTAVKGPFQNYSAKELTKICLDVRFLSRVYKYTRITDLDDENSDRRVRDLFTWSLEKDVDNGNSFIERAFWNDLFKRHGPGSKQTKRTTFRIGPPTRFQQLIYLSFVKHITSERNLPAAKRGRTGKGTHRAVQFVDGYIASNETHGRRMAHAVQTICKGWDFFASTLGFGDGEQMLLPYLLVEKKSLGFHVIESRSVGYSPELAFHTLGEELKPTLDVNDTVSWVHTLPDTIDANLRELAREFLADFSKIVLNGFLYKMSPTSRWNLLESFRPGRPARAPPRFNVFSEEYVSPIRQAVSVHNFQPSRLIPRAAPSGQDGGSNTVTVKVENAIQIPSSSKRNAAGKSSVNSDVIVILDSDNEEGDTPGASVGAKDNVPDGVLPPHDFDDTRTFNALDVVRGSMEKQFSMHCVGYDELVEAHGTIFPSDTSLEGNVQFVLTDPPYGIRDSEYDELADDDMDNTADIMASMLRPGGHFVLFCSIDQFGDWEEILREHKSEDAIGKKTASFLVDSTPMNFIRSRSNPLKNPARNTTRLFGATEYAVHGVRNGNPYAEQKVMVNYQNFNYVSARYPGHYSIIDQVPNLTPGESLRWRVKSGRRIRTAKARPEQKSRQLLMELIARFSNPGDVVVDLYSGTFSCALACMDIEGPRRFIGCEQDEQCFSHAMHNAIVHYARKVWRNELKMKEPVTNEVVQASYVVDAKFPERKRKTSTIWNAPKGFPSYQSFPFHIMSYLSTYWNEPGLITTYKEKPFHEWPLALQGKMTTLDSHTLLSVEATSLWLYVKKSNIKHAASGNGVFTSRAFSEGEVIGYFYGTLVYHDLSRRNTTHLTYEDGMMGATASRFRKYCMQVRVKGQMYNTLPHYDTEVNAGHAWIVPAPFCVAGYINDASYREGDEDKELE